MIFVRVALFRRQDSPPDFFHRADAKRAPFEELRTEIAFAFQAIGEPVLGDPDEFWIAPDFKIAVLILEFFPQEQSGHVEDDRFQTKLVRVLSQIEGYAFADQRLDLGNHRDVVRRQH